MNTLLTKLDHRWTTLTIRQPWTSTVTVYESLRLYLSTCPSKPVIPSKKPFKVDLIKGKRYSWCTCGYSKKQPFCDGSHKFKAKSMSPLRFVPETDKTVQLCGCKYTNNPPYCDGTHKLDFITSAPLHNQDS